MPVLALRNRLTTHQILYVDKDFLKINTLIIEYHSQIHINQYHIKYLIYVRSFFFAYHFIMYEFNVISQFFFFRSVLSGDKLIIYIYLKHLITENTYKNVTIKCIKIQKCNPCLEFMPAVKVQEGFFVSPGCSEKHSK